MAANKIMIIEDDDLVGRTIERALSRADYRTYWWRSGIDALKAARRNPPELIILDVMMPGMDGFSICKEIRSDPLLQDIPVLFLTAKLRDEDRIMGFTAGADDYVTKPFNITELALRIKAILRRSQDPQDKQPAGGETSQGPANRSQDSSDVVITVRDYSLNTRTYEVTTPKGKKIRVSPVQYQLLYHLMRHPGTIFTPQRLLDEVWNYPIDTGSPDLVRVHVRMLRTRLEENIKNPEFIQTVPGYGYAIMP